MIKIRITGTQFKYNQDDKMSVVELSYSTSDPKNQVEAYGNIPITTEEFFQVRGLSEMADMVRIKLIERLQESEQESTEE